MPKIYPTDRPTERPTETGRPVTEQRDTSPGHRDTGSGLKKTFGVYDQPFRASRAMIIALIIAAVVFLAVVIMLVQD